MERMPIELTKNPNAAALGAYGCKIETDGTLTGRFYAIKALTDVVITAIVCGPNVQGVAHMVGLTIYAGDVFLCYPCTSVTFTGTVQAFNSPA